MLSVHMQALMQSIKPTLTLNSVFACVCIILHFATAPAKFLEQLEIQIQHLNYKTLLGQ